MLIASPLLAQQSALGSLSQNFTLLDWLVLLGYMALVSYLGVRLAGKQKDLSDFFRGGAGLPWYAVTGSMIATIISAVTFVGVPSVAYQGDFTYLQFGLIAGLLSRTFVAFVLVPAYYRYEIFSPYDYMSRQLGEAARSVSTALFSVLGVLAQASRVYLTAIILRLVLASPLAWLADKTSIEPLIWAIGLVGLVSVVWTMLGGIATVIWTDAMLFLVFVAGGLVAIGVVAVEVPGGLGQVVTEGLAAGKFKLFSLGAGSDSAFATAAGRLFCEPYTLWAAIFAVTFGNIGSYGTDQLLAQRIFACRSARDAKIAVMASWSAELVAALMLFVGVGLWAFYHAFPDRLSGAAAAAVEENADNIFPVFILTQVPVALRGLIVAGIFAAAISSLTSILAALSQTTLSAVYLPLRGMNADAPVPTARNSEVLTASRLLVVFWGVVLCGMAIAIDRYVQHQEAAGKQIFFLNLALGLANYVVGTLFAAFLLAWLPLRCDAHGLIWSAPLSVFCVVACRFHDVSTLFLLLIVAGVLLSSWLIASFFHRRPERRGALFLKSGWLVLGCLLMLAIHRYLWFVKLDEVGGDPLLDDAGSVLRWSIEWPWYAPLGGSIAFVFGYLLAEPRQQPSLDMPSATTSGAA